MARRSFTPEELHELRCLAAQWGKSVSRRAFGDDGPRRDVDFSAMEQIALAAAAGLTEGTLQTFLEQQAAALGAQQPCPDGGRPCALRRQGRTLQVQGTQLHHREPLCHCPDCRRDFSPPNGPSCALMGTATAPPCSRRSSRPVPACTPSPTPPSPWA